MHRTCTALSIAAAALCVFGASGCDALRASMARTQYIHQQMAGYVYRQPLAGVWPAARQLVFERGFAIDDKGMDPGGYALETQWKDEGNGNSVRELVQGIQYENGASAVRFTAMTQTTDQYGRTYTGSGRDLDMEWLLVQQVDPQAAAQIQAGADQAGQYAVQQANPTQYAPQPTYAPQQQYAPPPQQQQPPPPPQQQQYAPQQPYAPQPQPGPQRR